VSDTLRGRNESLVTLANLTLAYTRRTLASILVAADDSDEVIRDGEPLSEDKAREMILGVQEAVERFGPVV
jgi:hypothetical protein